MDCLGNALKKNTILIKAMLGKLLIILLTESLRPIGHFKNGVQMFLNSLFLGENVSFLPILDMSTNEIISYDLSLSPDLEQIQRMLNKAFKKFPDVNGLILHSDQGWQYQHAFYQKSLRERGIIQSMSRKGNCYDNCIIETFLPE